MTSGGGRVGRQSVLVARPIVVLALVALLAAGLAGLWAGPAAAKSFSITGVAIDATVQPKDRKSTRLNSSH